MGWSSPGSSPLSLPPLATILSRHHHLHAGGGGEKRKESWYTFSHHLALSLTHSLNGIWSDCYSLQPHSYPSLLARGIINPTPREEEEKKEEEWRAKERNQPGLLFPLETETKGVKKNLLKFYIFHHSATRTAFVSQQISVHPGLWEGKGAKQSERRKSTQLSPESSYLLQWQDLFSERKTPRLDQHHGHCRRNPATITCTHYPYTTTAQFNPTRSLVSLFYRWRRRRWEAFCIPRRTEMCPSQQPKYNPLHSTQSHSWQLFIFMSFLFSTFSLFLILS